MAKYLVETISMFRIRYVVECDSAEDAKDTITLDEAQEFGQMHVDESIFSCREVKDEEIPTLFFEDNPHLQEWGPSRAMEYVHKVKY